MQVQDLGNQMAPWVAMSALAISVLTQVLNWRTFKEFQTLFAPASLQKEHDELKKFVASMDYTARTDFDKEILRINNETTEDIRQLRIAIDNLRASSENRHESLRKLIEDLGRTANSLHEEDLRIRHAFELLKKDLEHAVDVHKLIDKLTDKEKAG